MQNGSPYAISIRIRPGIVLNRPTACRTQMVGTMAGGTIRPARISPLITGLSRLARRCQTYATMALKMTRAATLTTVRITLLMNAMIIR